MIHLVSKKSDADLAKDRAFTEVKFALRNHAANLLRVLSGSGRPISLMNDSNRLAKALANYAIITGHAVPDHQIRDMVSYRTCLKEYRPWVNDTDRRKVDVNIEDAKMQVVKGALRIVSSYLLDQMTQQSAAEQLMDDGIKRRAEAYKEWGKVR